MATVTNTTGQRDSATPWHCLLFLPARSSPSSAPILLRRSCLLGRLSAPFPRLTKLTGRALRQLVSTGRGGKGHAKRSAGRFFPPDARPAILDHPLITRANVLPLDNEGSDPPSMLCHHRRQSSRERTSSPAPRARRRRLSFSCLGTAAASAHRVTQWRQHSRAKQNLRLRLRLNILLFAALGGEACVWGDVSCKRRWP